MKKILVAMDGSPREPAVVAAAARLGALGAQLVLLRAIALPVELPHEVLSMRPDDVLATLERAARAALAARAAELPAALAPTIRVDVGMPWRAICDAAEAERADLIVLGSHGYGGVDRLLGTTAAKVVNHAPCSVLVVKG